jgi:hypothetical protein
MNEREGEKKWKYYLHRIQDNSPTGSTGCHDTNHHGCHNSDAITSGNMALHIRRGLKRLESLSVGTRAPVFTTFKRKQSVFMSQFLALSYVHRLAEVGFDETSNKEE